MSEINKILKRVVIFMFILFSNSYSEPNSYLEPKKSDYLLLLIKRGDGIFIYNFNKKTEIKVFEFQDTKEEMDDESKFRIIDDNIYLVTCNDYYEKEEAIMFKNGAYFENEYLVDLKAVRCYLLKRREYEIKKTSVTITDTTYSKKGNCENIRKYETNAFPELEKNPILIQESRTVNGIKIIAREGNLYISSPESEKLLLKHRKDFRGKSEKFLWGYAQPDLSNDGEKVIFQDVHYEDIKGFWNKITEYLGLPQYLMKEETYLIELNLKTMKQKVFKINKIINSPRYSPTGKLVLMYDFKFDPTETFPFNDFYIFDLETEKLYQIPSCENAFWIK